MLHCEECGGELRDGVCPFCGGSEQRFIGLQSRFNDVQCRFNRWQVAYDIAVIVAIIYLLILTSCR